MSGLILSAKEQSRFNCKRDAVLPSSAPLFATRLIRSSLTQSVLGCTSILEATVH